MVKPPAGSLFPPQTPRFPGNFAAFLLDERASLWPDKTALRCQGRSLSYAELSGLVGRMAGFLASRGLGPGKRVLLVLPDSFSLAAAFLGSVLTGGVAVLQNPRLLVADHVECLANRAPDIVPGKAGRTIPPYEAVVLDARGRPALDGTPGHLAMRGPSVMRGYLNDPEWTGRMFTGDGFLYTGDMAVREDGVYAILGRRDDMFKTGGLWVSPARVEDALMSHPAMGECAVTGGQAAGFTLVRAHVAPTPGFTPGPDLDEDIRAHAAGALPDFLVPAEIVFRASLPLTASGKVQRYKLRDGGLDRCESENKEHET